MTRRALSFFIVALVLTLGALPLHAAYDAFLKIDGVPGESTDDKHRDWIEVLSYNQPSLRQEQGTHSATGGAGSGRLSFNSLTLTKKHDKASPKLYEAMTKGTHYPSAVLHVRKAGGQEYLEYKLENVMISGYQLGAGGQGGAQPTESLSLNFTKIEYVYKEQGKKPAGAGAGVAGASALAGAAAVAAPTPTATPGRPAAMVPKK